MFGDCDPSLAAGLWLTRLLHHFTDVIYLKVRVDHRIRPMALMIAMGMTRDAMKELIGFRLKACESRETWGRFLSSLHARGLSGSSMFTSDAHEGLVF